MSSSIFSVCEETKPAIKEAYRVLRTNVRFCSAGEELKTIAITSCNQGEGKTTTAINLAVSMAEAGIKILLVDADLRKPLLSKQYKVEERVGLTNVLMGYIPLQEAVIETNIDNLSFIACGPVPPNPAELIGTEAFKQFLDNVREQFDMVILDTPPLGSVIDCALVSSRADGTLIVIEANKTDYRNSRRIKSQLERANARILGVVLNKTSKNDSSYYYGYVPRSRDERGRFKRWLKKIRPVPKKGMAKND